MYVCLHQLREHLFCWLPQTQIPANASKRIVDQLNDIRAKVEEELGGPGSFATDRLSHAADADEQKIYVNQPHNQEERTEHRLRTFLCVTPDNLVAGYLTVEPVRSDAVIDLPIEGEQKLPEISGDEAAQPTTSPSSCSSANTAVAAAATEEGDTEGWHMGIRHIWVAPSFRRKGVATALIRAASLVFAVAGGCAVAFSQPTAQGSLLAAAFLDAKTHIPAYR